MICSLCSCCLHCCCSMFSGVRHWFNQVFCTTIAVCCFMFGMVIMAILIALYYIVFLSSTPSASLEHTAMYDYAHYHDVKRDVSYEHVNNVSDGDDKGKQHDILDQYYNYVLETEQEEHDDVDDYVSIFINKRDASLPTNNFGVTSTRPTASNVPSSTPATRQPGGTVADILAGTPSGKSETKKTIPSSHRAEEMIEPVPDFRISNSLINTVFDKSEAENWTMSLGLCRKNADVNMPSFNATTLRVESSGDIQTCINNILQSVTINKLCYQLDPEMSAYLKWLVLAGEPRGKQRKPASIGVANGFLFASNSCDVVSQGGIAVNQKGG